jgi:hypothetical protein
MNRQKPTPSALSVLQEVSTHVVYKRYSAAGNLVATAAVAAGAHAVLTRVMSGKGGSGSGNGNGNGNGKKNEIEEIAGKSCESARVGIKAAAVDVLWRSVRERWMERRKKKIGEEERYVLISCFLPFFVSDISRVKMKLEF